MGGRSGGAKSFNTIGNDGFAKTATIIRPGAPAYRGEDPLKLVGQQKGNFIVHETNTLQSVTHVPSGARLASFDNLKQAKSFVDKLQPIDGSVSKLIEHEYRYGSGSGLNRAKNPLSSRDQSATRRAISDARDKAKLENDTPQKTASKFSNIRNARAKKREDRIVMD